MKNIKHVKNTKLFDFCVLIMKSITGEFNNGYTNREQTRIDDKWDRKNNKFTPFEMESSK